MPRRNIAGSFAKELARKPSARWRKGFQLEVWTLLCRAQRPNEPDKPFTGYLGLPESMWDKAQSQEAANIWWDEKIKQLAIESVPNEINAIDKKIAYAKVYKPDELNHLKKVKLQILKAIKDDPNEPDTVPDDMDDIRKNIEIAEMFDIQVPVGLDPIVASKFFDNTDVWIDRLQTAPTVETNKTFSYQLDQFFDKLRINNKPQSFNDVYAYLNKVKDFFGESFDCSTIDEETINRHYLWLASQSIIPDSKNKRLAMFRRFVNVVWMNKTLTIKPRNLLDRTHRFKVRLGKIKVFTEVKEAINLLPRDKQLWAMLGLNCGMTQADMGALTWSMIDLVKGTLTRKRVKTEDVIDVPTVTYKLFPETLILLHELTKKDGLVFTTKNGKPMYETRYDKVTRQAKKKDLFSLQWKRMKVKPTIGLSRYRSIATTTLKKDVVFYAFRFVFLGQKPKDLPDTNYGAESDEPFFKVLDFIHKNIFGEPDT